MNHGTDDRETIASLLRTIALIREAAGVDEKPMLSELPDAIRKLRKERDEAVRNLAEMKKDESDLFAHLAWTAEDAARDRDEARRRVCEMSLELGKIFRRVDGKTVEVTTAEGVADMMKWDCYNHEYKRRQRALDEVARISEQLELDSPPKPQDFLQDHG